MSPFEASSCHSLKIQRISLMSPILPAQRCDQGWVGVSWRRAIKSCFRRVCYLIEIRPPSRGFLRTLQPQVKYRTSRKTSLLNYWTTFRNCAETVPFKLRDYFSKLRAYAFWGVEQIDFQKLADRALPSRISAVSLPSAEEGLLSSLALSGKPFDEISEFIRQLAKPGSKL